MKKVIISILLVSSIFIITGCNNTKEERNNSKNKQQITNTKKKESNNSKKVIKTVKAIINGKEYNIMLEDNETSRVFINLLPQELKMNELNGNEKYVNLDTTLPTNSYNPKRINAGDVMLYGNNCIVIFYKSFDTPYSYTKIGHIDNLNDLGSESIIASFNK